jgi:hypothetical protein
LAEIPTGNLPTSRFSFAATSNHFKRKRTAISLAKLYSMREYGGMQVNLHVYLTSVLIKTVPTGPEA